MRRTITWMFALLALTVGTVRAQGGGGMGGMGGGRGGAGGMSGGGRRGGATGGGARESNMKFPSAKKLEKYNPAALMLDKHKKLKLTDAQVARFKELKGSLFERNATLLARYDALQKDFRPPRMAARSGPPEGGARGGGRDGGGRDGGTIDPAADSARRQAMMDMRQLSLLGDSLQERRRADVRDVLEALADEAQRKKAAEFLDKQDVKFSGEFPAPPAPPGTRSRPDELPRRPD